MSWYWKWIVGHLSGANVDTTYDQDDDQHKCASHKKRIEPNNSIYFMLDI